MNSSNSLIKSSLLILGFAGMLGFGLNWHIAVAAWLAPVFLLGFVRNTKILGFLLFVLIAVIAGIITRTCFAFNFDLSVFLINGLIFAIPYCIPYLIDKLLYKRKAGYWNSFIFPSAVVVFEYLVSKVFGTWGVLAHTQYSLNNLIQISSVTGFFGISFLISWFASTLNWIIENNDDKSATRTAIISYGSVFIFVFVFGIVRTNFNPIKSKTVRIAGISSEIDIHQIVEEEKDAWESLRSNPNTRFQQNFFSEDSIIKNQLEKSMFAALNKAEIIVWNEISLILNRHQADSVKTLIRLMASATNTYILVAWLETSNTHAEKPFNNKSILITPEGKVAWEYMKSALHPQAEAPVINAGNFQIPYFDTEYGRLGSVICYDMDFPDYIKQAGKQEIDIMLVPAYDWEEISPLHAYMAGFEAIQNGFSLVRPNGKGLSVMFDYYGRSIARMNTLETNTKILYADIPVQSVSTFYSVIGNTFVYLCLLLLLMIFGLRIFHIVWRS